MPVFRCCARACSSDARILASAAISSIQVAVGMPPAIASCAPSGVVMPPAVATEPRVAAVLGGSGAVGTEVVKHLSSRPEQWSLVLLLLRRSVPALATLPRVREHVLAMGDEAALQSRPGRL